MKNRNKTKLLPHLGWPAKKCDYRPLLYCCITTISSSFSNIRFVCIFIRDHHYISRRKKAQILPPPCSVILLVLFLKCQWFFFVSQSAAAALQTFYYWEEYYLKLKHLKNVYIISSARDWTLLNQLLFTVNLFKILTICSTNPLQEPIVPIYTTNEWNKMH